MPAARLDPDAERELAAAATHYEQERAGLGRDFLAEFQLVLRRLEELPRTGALVSGMGDHEVRRYAFKRFPYKVLAVIGEDRITVLAVAHDKRHPEYWRERLER